MKPKKDLIKIGIRIIVKNAFKGTLISSYETEECRIGRTESHIKGLIDSMHFDYNNMEKWENWIKFRKSNRWGKRRILNKIEKNQFIK